MNLSEGKPTAPPPAPAPVAADAVTYREFIDCDACGVANPQKRCSGCMVTYYCSKECQQLHWNDHRSGCRMLKQSKKPIEVKVPDSKASDTMRGPCSICLDEIAINPVVLNCKHVFCFECIHKYQDSKMQAAHESLGKSYIIHPCALNVEGTCRMSGI